MLYLFLEIFIQQGALKFGESLQDPQWVPKLQIPKTSFYFIFLCIHFCDTV